MTDRTAAEINRLLAWTVGILLTASALILTPPILAAVDFLLS